MNKLTGTENKLMGSRFGVSGAMGEKGDRIKKYKLAAMKTVTGM